jgi:hypothetical protein
MQFLQRFLLVIFLLRNFCVDQKITFMTFILCFTSYIAHARDHELALGDMKLIL